MTPLLYYCTVLLNFEPADKSADEITAPELSVEKHEEGDDSQGTVHKLGDAAFRKIETEEV